MKKLSMILTVLVIFGSSAIGHTSDECVVFEGTFEKSTRRPVAKFEHFQALDGEAILKVYNESKGRHAKKFTSATIAINGKKVVHSWDFYKKKFWRFWHHRKWKFYHHSHYKYQDGYLEKTVKLTNGQNSIEVMMHSCRSGKIKVAIVKPKYLGSDDSDCDFIPDEGYEEICTGGNTNSCNDNCPNDFNPDQADMDGDRIGDVCDAGDTYPNSVVDSIPVATGLHNGIAVSPNSEYVYVSNYDDIDDDVDYGTVSVIKTLDNTVIKTIDVGEGPSGISVTPDGTHAYVINSGDGTVSVIQTLDNTVIKTIGVGEGPSGISVTPDGTHAYVTNFGGETGTVSVIDILNNTVIKTIDVDIAPSGISVTPDGNFVYVANHFGKILQGTVSVIKTEDNTVIDTIDVGGRPEGVSVIPNSAYVYVTNSGGEPGTVSVIDTLNNTVIDTDPSTDEIEPISVGNGPSGISVTPDGAYAYVSNSGDRTVSVIQTSDHTVIETIQIPGNPENELHGGIAVSPDGEFVYVGNSEEGNSEESNVTVIGF